MKHRFAVLLALVILSSSLLGGFLGGDAAAKSGPVQNSANEFLENFTEALDIIQQTYAEEIGADKLVYSAIKAMLRALDPHSSFFDPEEFARLREEQHSKYFGLGIKVRALLGDHGRMMIVEPPVIGSPAEKRGLRAGDVITHIEEEPIDDWTTDDVIKNLRGPRGTTVNITIERPGVPDPLQFEVERDEIPLITVKYAFEIKPGIGYVMIDRFSESTAEELKGKLEEIDATHLAGIILDLRGNQGGLLSQAIEVADFFLPRGDLVVSTKGRTPGSDRPYRAPNQEKIKSPLVILINRQSASASEIVAGALQDHDRALIVGETSFGKGLVQSVYNLENSTGLALTTAKYYTPSGRLIQRDYAGSYFEYYYLSGGTIPPEKDREIRYTDSGRTVYGGGGITPDIIVPMRDLTRFEALLSSRDIYFEYIRYLNSEQIPAANNLPLPLKNGEVPSSAENSAKEVPVVEISDELLKNFREFLHNQNMDFSDEDFQENVDSIRQSIKKEIYESSFGLQEAHKVEVQGDNQVLKALEVMPEAKLLMTTGRLAPAAQNPR